MFSTPPPKKKGTLHFAKSKMITFTQSLNGNLSWLFAKPPQMEATLSKVKDFSAHQKHQKGTKSGVCESYPSESGGFVLGSLETLLTWQSVASVLGAP